jgi:membrane-associated protease RseP (regulator of RpoE activity)
VSDGRIETLTTTDPDLDADTADEAAPAAKVPPHRKRTIAAAVGLFVLTFLSTTYVGSQNSGAAVPNFWEGLRYSVPLMSILLCHELGHYIAARIHGVPSSPPFFIPMPVPPLGTMGAVILMSGRITRRNALLDIGAAGPLAGMAVALPVLIYGIITSPVGPLPEHTGYMAEGHSLLYAGLLRILKGPIPEGHDIQLSLTAFAGWAGMLVTMINLIPAGQLDGGHVAYALFGERQERYSRRVRGALLPIAVLVSLAYGLQAYNQGARGDALIEGFAPGAHWAMWWLMLRFVVGRGKREHPATDDAVLSPRRRVIAWGTLALFVALFMPAWLRQVSPPDEAQSAQSPESTE